MPVRNRFAEMLPEIIDWRRDLHENPEIMYETHRTAGIVADKLKSFGCDEVTPGIGRVGVVGVIKGRTDTSGRVVGLRADMDAPEIDEHIQTSIDLTATLGFSGTPSFVIGDALVAGFAETSELEQHVAVAREAIE